MIIEIRKPRDIWKKYRLAEKTLTEKNPTPYESEKAWNTILKFVNFAHNRIEDIITYQNKGLRRNSGVKARDALRNRAKRAQRILESMPDSLRNRIEAPKPLELKEDNYSDPHSEEYWKDVIPERSETKKKLLRLWSKSRIEVK